MKLIKKFLKAGVLTSVPNIETPEGKAYYQQLAEKLKEEEDKLQLYDLHNGTYWWGTDKDGQEVFPISLIGDDKRNWTFSTKDGKIIGYKNKTGVNENRDKLSEAYVDDSWLRNFYNWSNSHRNDPVLGAWARLVDDWDNGTSPIKAVIQNPGFAVTPYGMVANGVTEFFGDNGYRKTKKEFSQGNTWNGIKSATGDLLSASMFVPGIVTSSGKAFKQVIDKAAASYAKYNPESFYKLRTRLDDFKDYDMYTKEGNPENTFATDVLNTSSKGKGEVEQLGTQNRAILGSSETGEVELQLPNGGYNGLQGSNAHINLWNGTLPVITRNIRMQAAKIPNLLPRRINITSSDVPNTGYIATFSKNPFTDIMQGKLKRLDFGNYSWQSLPLNVSMGNKTGFVLRNTGNLGGFNRMASHSEALSLNNELNRYGTSIEDIINNSENALKLPEESIWYLIENGFLKLKDGKFLTTDKLLQLNKSTSHPDYQLMREIFERGEDPYTVSTWGPKTIDSFNKRFSGQLRYPAYINKEGSAVVPFPTALKIGTKSEGNALRGAGKAMGNQLYFLSKDLGSNLLERVRSLFKKQEKDPWEGYEIPNETNSGWLDENGNVIEDTDIYQGTFKFGGKLIKRNKR